MEKLRLGRIKRAVSGEDLVNDRDELLLVQGVTPRIADLLLHAGYRNVRELSSEEDIDRLAIRTGLGSKRAQAIHEGVVYYSGEDAERVAEGQRGARARQDAAHQSELAERESRAQAAAGHGAHDASNNPNGAAAAGPEAAGGASGAGETEARN
jgi:Holliday junction resolvasome RuvABC DNA-binding subunit